MQTSDILGSSDSKIGNVDVLSNGGRIQPGCYRNENNINECKIPIFCNIISISFLFIDKKYNIFLKWDLQSSVHLIVEYNFFITAWDQTIKPGFISFDIGF